MAQGSKGTEADNKTGLKNVHTRTCASARLHSKSSDRRGRTVTLQVKFNDFEIITRSRSVPAAISKRADLERMSISMLRNEMPVRKPVRLLGASLSPL